MLAFCDRALSASSGYVYDALGRLVAAYDASGNAAVYHYDAAGNLLSISRLGATQLSIIDLSPASGAPGSTITINGTGFCSHPTVTFNGVAATVLLATSTQIVVKVPAGTTSGPIVVTCGATHTTSGNFSIGSKAPSITGFIPGIGPAGTSVAVSGASFQTPAANDYLRFNISPAVISSVTSNSMHTAVPNGATTGHISVTTSYGQGISAGYFFIPPAGVPAAGLVTGQLAIGGTAKTATLKANGNAIFAFDGAAGQLISLAAPSVTLQCPTVSILTPNGSTLASSDLCGPGSIPLLTLPLGGTYLVLIAAGNKAGSITMQVTNALQGPIAIGAPPITKALGLGQDGYLSFNGKAGQQLVVNVTNLTNCASFGIVGPGGVTPVGPDEICLPGALAVGGLPVDGPYAVEIIEAMPGAQSISLQLWDLTDLANQVNVSDTYAKAVLADSPSYYWRLDDVHPATAINAVPTLRRTPGPTVPDTAITLSGNASIIMTAADTNPQPFTEEAWFKTTSKSGGVLIAFSDSQTGTPLIVDRALYMNNTGKLLFEVESSQVNPVQVASPLSYNDGKWHHAAATFTKAGQLILYVDGLKVAASASGVGEGLGNYRGYWQIGFTDTGLLPTQPTSAYFQGALSEAALWNTVALTAAQVSNHFASASGGHYDSVVLADHPSSYWKLNEPSGITFTDATGAGNTGTAQSPSNNGAYVGGVSFGQPGQIAADKAVTLDGISGYLTSQFTLTNPGPLSEEIWFKTKTTSGGRLIGFGDTQEGQSFNADRNIYMTNTGKLIFGTEDGSLTMHIAQSAKAYNDGLWHYAAATWAGNTLKLYVDGAPAGSASGAAGNYAGFWRLGYDDLSLWPSAPASNFFAGGIDEAAIYNYALSATQVFNHFKASGR